MDEDCAGNSVAALACCSDVAFGSHDAHPHVLAHCRDDRWDACLSLSLSLCSNEITLYCSVRYCIIRGPEHGTHVLSSNQREPLSVLMIGNAIKTVHPYLCWIRKHLWSETLHPGGWVLGAGRLCASVVPPDPGRR